MITVVLLFILGLVLICLGGDRLVDAAVAIANKIGIPQIVVGATIVSLGTTLPEILVSTTAAFSGSTEIAAGNAFGSIICNTALIAGVTQVIRPTSKVETKPLGWRAGMFFGILAILFGFGFFTSNFPRPIGWFLLIMFCFYAYLNIARAGVEGSDEEEGEEVEGSLVKHFITLAICAALLYFGANLLVDNGILIAQALGVPERVIAVTFIALGTSLPELVTSITSLLKGYENVGFGNILGANILNMLLVMGIPAAVGGIPLTDSVARVDIPVGGLAMAILIVPILIKKKAYRLQGIALLAIYALYCGSSFLK